METNRKVWGKFESRLGASQALSVVAGLIVAYGPQVVGLPIWGPESLPAVTAGVSVALWLAHLYLGDNSKLPPPKIREVR